MKEWFLEDFMECESCAAKPGSPPLCNSCQHNRAVVGMLKDEIRTRHSKMNLVKKLIDL